MRGNASLGRAGAFIATLIVVGGVVSGLHAYMRTQLPLASALSNLYTFQIHPDSKSLRVFFDFMFPIAAIGIAAGVALRGRPMWIGYITIYATSIAWIWLHRLIIHADAGSAIACPYASPGYYFKSLIFVWWLLLGVTLGTIILLKQRQPVEPSANDTPDGSTGG